MAYGFGSILPAVTVAPIFTEHFHFDPLTIGLAYGGALTIGGVLGEFGGGMVVDRIMNRERQLRGKDVEPEVRLKAIWTGEILVPVSSFTMPRRQRLMNICADRTPHVWIWCPIQCSLHDTCQSFISYRSVSEEH